MKECNKCEVEKPLSEYTKRKDAKDGLGGWCKECHKKHKKRYRASDNGKRVEIISTMYHGSVSRAKEKGLEHNLTLDWINDNIPTHCVYSKRVLTYNRGHGRDKRCLTNISIDRINNDGGYTIDNVQFISWYANLMKEKLLPEDFKDKMLLLEKGELGLESGYLK